MQLFLQNGDENRVESKSFVTGERFLLLGSYYTLEIRKSDSRAGTVGLVEDHLVVFVRTNADQAKEVQDALLGWYRKQAQVWILRRVHYYQNIMNESVGRITLKNQKTRWGSCSSARNLNFNWRLVMAPIEVLDYVVVHELCHLKQMNHSKAFWNEVEKVLPDYGIRKKWLDKQRISL